MENFPHRAPSETPLSIAQPTAADQRAMDIVLITLVAEGDSQAFSRLYDRLAAPLFSLILRVLEDRVESEDVLQETFVLLWKKAGAYQSDRSSVFSWAVTLARGKAIDRLRSRQRRQRVIAPGTDELPEPAIEKEEPRQAASDLDRLLSLLPPDQRQAIDLAYFSGLTHEEISVRLAQPLGTIKARIRRGLLKLREVLAR